MKRHRLAVFSGGKLVGMGKDPPSVNKVLADEYRKDHQVSIRRMLK